MAKTPHTQSQQPGSKSAMIFLTIGGLLVAALVVWALTRTVETPPSATSSIADAAPSSAPVTPDAQTSTDAIASASAPITATSMEVSPERAEKDAFPRISAEDSYERFKAGTAVIVDVRDAGSYAAGHIAGSLSIPLSSIEANLDLLPKDKEIIAYCTCPAEESSITAGVILQRHGYTKVSALFGGLSAWRNLGYQVESGEPKS